MTIRTRMVAMAAVAALVSCAERTGYGDLTQRQRERVEKLTYPIDSLEADGKIHLVSDDNVRRFVANKQDAIVYVFTPSDKKAQHPYLLKFPCYLHGIKYCTVATGFEQMYEWTRYYKGCPIMVIDHEAYGTDLRKAYVEQFVRKLTGDGSWEWRLSGTFLVFMDGKFELAVHDRDHAVSYITNKRYPSFPFPRIDTP